MNYTLHKLQEGFIVTSDEEIKEGNKIYWNGKAFGGPNDNIYIEFSGIYEVEESIGLGDGGITLPTNLYLKIGYNIDSYNCKKLIAQQDQINFSGLTEEEQKEIGWFDVEKICVKDLEGLYGTIPDIGHIDETYVSGFKTGFSVAQKLLSDRRFTLEDMNQSVFIGARNSTTPEKAARELNNYIQSLSKQSWKVELEMEFIPQALPQDRYKPTLTDGKVKILKLL
jgi:hypothetical protein